MSPLERFARAAIGIAIGVALAFMSYQSAGPRPYIIVLGGGAILLGCLGAALLAMKTVELRRQRLLFQGSLVWMLLVILSAVIELAFLARETMYPLVVIGLMSLFFWLAYENLRRLPRVAAKMPQRTDK